MKIKAEEKKSGSIRVRLRQSTIDFLKKKSNQFDLPTSEIVRQLLEMYRESESKKKRLNKMKKVKMN
jgi:hypothetical protein